MCKKNGLRSVKLCSRKTFHPIIKSNTLEALSCGCAGLNECEWLSFTALIIIFCSFGQFQRR